ncbi:hypothetical protein [Stenotrophomonas phage RAS14]
MSYHSPLEVFATIAVIYISGAAVTHLGSRILEVLNYLRYTSVDGTKVTAYGIKRAWRLEGESDTFEYVLFVGTLFWPFAWIVNPFLYHKTFMWVIGYPARSLNIRMPYWMTVQGFADRVNKKREARR